MRPDRFQNFALDVLKNTPGTVRVQTLADAGDTKYPYGLAIVTADGETRWQIIGQLADGERHDNADTPVEGDPAVWHAAEPGDGPEAWMAAVVGQAESPEIARIERWSVREGERPDHQGLTVFFHNGAKAYVRKL